MGCNSIIESSRNYEFLDFIKLFEAKEQRVLKLFYEYVIDKMIIPYKIRRKNFQVEVMSSPAFSIHLIFKNVLIEDGRHPKELLLSNPSGEVFNGKYRFRFTNHLAKEGTVKESSFVFDKVEAVIKLWNYEFNMIDLRQTPDKLPWRLVYEPIASLIHKYMILGDDYLNEYEMKYYGVFRFLYKYITLYLSDETRIGFGKTKLQYNYRKVIKHPMDFKSIDAAKMMFAECQIADLTELLTGDEPGSRQFFEAFIWLITQKDGQVIYGYVNHAITRCTENYPRIKHLLPAYSNHHYNIENTLNTIFSSRHWEGHYPNFRRIERPKFIETYNVYERKYTYINEKEKIIFVSFIESIVEGELVMTAIKGSALVRYKNRDRLLEAKASDCYFTDGGKRTCEIVDSIIIEQDANQEAVQDLLVKLYKDIQKT